MAWTAPSDRSTGDIITAAQWNSFLGASGNMTMTGAGVVTTAGDTVYATAANTLARLAKGTSRQQLSMNSGATAPEWVASPASLLTTTGDILYASGANTPARLAAGADGLVLTGTGAGSLPAWEAVSAGPTRTYKTADETVNNSAVLQNDDALVDIALDASSTYAFKMLFLFSTATAAGIMLAPTLSDGSSNFYTHGTWYDKAQSKAYWYPSVNTASPAASTYDSTTAGGGYIGSQHIDGVIHTSSSGTLYLRWAQSATTASDTKLLKGSYVEIEKAS